MAVLVRSDLSKDAELLVLRRENQALRRQLRSPDIETRPIPDVVGTGWF